MHQTEPAQCPVSQRKRCAAILKQIATVKFAAGTKSDFVVVVQLDADASMPHSLGSLLIFNRLVDAITNLQTSLAQARCRKASCTVCGHFSDLPRLSIGSTDRLILNHQQIHGLFEARLGRIVRTAANLVASDSLEMRCVAQMQSIVSDLFLYGLHHGDP